MGTLLYISFGKFFLFPEIFVPVPRVSAPGEIRQEYEAQIEREQKELASRRSQEEEASNKLIQQLHVSF